MSYTHRRIMSLLSTSGTATGEVQATADVELELTMSIPKATTDLEIALPIDVSLVESLFILSTLDMTLCTNDASTGSPDNTLSLAAGQAVVFIAGGSETNALTADVTSIFVTNADVDNAATLSIRVLLNTAD